MTSYNEISFRNTKENLALETDVYSVRNVEVITNLKPYT